MTSGSRLVRMPITAVGTSTPPNLLFTAFTATSPVTAGGPITISATVQNSGAGAAGPFFLDFFVSSDATLSNDDVYFVSCQFQGLGAGASGICSGTVAFDPASPVSPGSYDLLAVLDLDGAVAESDETDNVAAVALVVQ
jgi:subtilase family serine protease